MKRLYIIGGPMGVGKTTVSRMLRDKLPDSVFLDGDWCWDMSPFQVTEETKKLVIDNICCLLGNFLRCTMFENIIFCWVLHEQRTIDEILFRLDLTGCEVKKISLVCREDALAARLKNDVSEGKRSADIVERSLSRLSMYTELSTLKLDVSDISPKEAAERISRL